jgi:hypothetical protein
MGKQGGGIWERPDTYGYLPPPFFQAVPPRHGRRRGFVGFRVHEKGKHDVTDRPLLASSFFDCFDLQQRHGGGVVPPAGREPLFSGKKRVSRGSCIRRFMHSGQTVLFSVARIVVVRLAYCTLYRASTSVPGFGKAPTRTCRWWKRGENARLSSRALIMKSGASCSPAALITLPTTLVMVTFGGKNRAASTQNTSPSPG